MPGQRGHKGPRALKALKARVAKEAGKDPQNKLYPNPQVKDLGLQMGAFERVVRGSGPKKLRYGLFA